VGINMNKALSATRQMKTTVLVPHLPPPPLTPGVNSELAVSVANGNLPIGSIAGSTGQHAAELSGETSQL
jgi:hypothetical protein